MRQPDHRWHPAPSHVTLTQTSKLGQKSIDKMQKGSMFAGSPLLSRIAMVILLFAALAVLAIMVDRN